VQITLFTKCCSRGYNYVLIAVKMLRERGIEVTIGGIIRVNTKQDSYYGIKTEEIIKRPYILIDDKMIEAKHIKEYLNEQKT
jgi:hypothetical protein